MLSRDQGLVWLYSAPSEVTTLPDTQRSSIDISWMEQMSEKMNEWNEIMACVLSVFNVKFQNKLLFLQNSTRATTAFGYKHEGNRFTLISGRSECPFVFSNEPRVSKAANLDTHSLFNLIFQKKVLHKIKQQLPLSPPLPATFQHTHIITLISPWRICGGEAPMPGLCDNSPTLWASGGLPDP